MIGQRTRAFAIILCKMIDSWLNTSVMRALAVFSIVLLAACGDANTPEDFMSRAMSLRAEGQPEAAINTLRGAMRLSPDDADIRLLLAEVYLDLNEGALAINALDQALDRGLNPLRAVLPRVRALSAEGRLREVIELAIPSGLHIGDYVGVQYMKAEALAERSTSKDGLDDEVTRAYIGLFDVVEQNLNERKVAAVAALLSKARKQRLEVGRAWQHHDCKQAKAETTGWQPLVQSSARVLRVGPKREFETVAAAAHAATDGDVVEIDPGTYPGDVVIWPQSHLLVRGAGSRPLITANGKGVEDRDIWLFTGDEVVIENVEISGARSRFENGAAIRHIGAGLTLRHVYLHDNENGVLTGNRYTETNQVLIEFSEFARNGDGRGYAHNIYIGRSKRFELRYSFSHESRGGHLVKSRAQNNVIAYNRLTDGEDGTSSYIIDIPEGGAAVVLGNVIEQGPATINNGMISFAGEDVRHADSRLVIVNNSIYNRDFRGIAVRNNAGLNVVMVNNLFGGAPVATSDGDIELINNLTLSEHGMVDPRNYDFSLTSSAHAIDTGIDFDVKPLKEYVHPTQWRQRQAVWRIDNGAYELCDL